MKQPSERAKKKLSEAHADKFSSGGEEIEFGTSNKIIRYKGKKTTLKKLWDMLKPGQEFNIDEDGNATIT